MEARIREFPGVVDAAVVGLQDEEENLYAFVVAEALNEVDLRGFLAGLNNATECFFFRTAYCSKDSNTVHLDKLDQTRCDRKN